LVFDAFRDKKHDIGIGFKSETGPCADN
jgi:hypothetical protein